MATFYCSTATSNAWAHSMVCKALADLGYKLTHDWTKEGTWRGQAALQRRKMAADEMQAVRDAYFTVVILRGFEGAHAELGAALGLGRQVYILDWDRVGRLDCVFYYHPLVKWFVDLDEMLAAIKEDFPCHT